MTDFASISDNQYPKEFYDSGGGSADFLQPTKMLSGALRGSQIILGSDGSKVILGELPGTNNEFGIGFYDPNGKLIMKFVSSTLYTYDPNSDKNVLQFGKLPDATYGWAIARTGNNVSEGF